VLVNESNRENGMMDVTISWNGKGYCVMLWNAWGKLYWEGKLICGQNIPTSYKRGVSLEKSITKERRRVRGNRPEGGGLKKTKNKSLEEAKTEEWPKTLRVAQGKGKKMPTKYEAKSLDGI